MTKEIEWPERQEKTWNIGASQKPRGENVSKRKWVDDRNNAEEYSNEIRLGKCAFDLGSYFVEW